MASTASVSSDEGPQQIVDLALDTWGRVDALIHNAAIVLDDHFEDVTDDDFDSITTVNLRGTFRTVRAVYRAMKDGGGGRIVTLTSASGLSGAFGQAAYATTKMGGHRYDPLGGLGRHALRNQGERPGSCGL